MEGLWKIFRPRVLNLRPDLKIDYVSVCETMQELVLSETKKKVWLVELGKKLTKKNIRILFQISLYHSVVLTLWRRNFLLNFSTPCI